MALVNAVVVHDEMNASGFPIVASQPIQQLPKELAVLREVASRVDPARPHVQSAREIELLVLSWRDDLALLSRQHPVPTDLGVEVYVDLVGVQDRLALRSAGLKPTNLPQHAFSSGRGPRAEDDRLGRSETSAELPQSSSHGAYGYTIESALLQFQAEEFPCPRRSQPSEIGRNAGENGAEPGQEQVGHLAVTVMTTLVFEGRRTTPKIPSPRSGHMGDRYSKETRHLRDPLARPEHHDDLEPLLGGRGRLPASLQQTASLRATNSEYALWHGTSLVFVSSQTELSMVGPVFSTTYRDPESRPVI